MADTLNLAALAGMALIGAAAQFMIHARYQLCTQAVCAKASTSAFLLEASDGQAIQVNNLTLRPSIRDRGGQAPTAADLDVSFKPLLEGARCL